jgi:hypothetical protein
MLAECGKPNARVQVLTNPRVQGYEHARLRLPEVLDRYRHFDLVLFLVDADGKNRAAAFQALECKRQSNRVYTGGLSGAEVELCWRQESIAGTETGPKQIS